MNLQVLAQLLLYAFILAATATPPVEAYPSQFGAGFVTRSVPLSGNTVAEASSAVFDFIEGWYNPHRRHSALGYLSPNNFERRMSEAA